MTAPVGDLVDETAPVDPEAARKLSRYTGTYRNGYYGKAVVKQRDGQLVVSLGPKGGYRFTLAHWTGDTFQFVPTGENAPDGSSSSARFTFKNGKARSLRLNFFDAAGHRRWTR